MPKEWKIEKHVCNQQKYTWYEKRKKEKFKVKNIRTERYRKSALPYMTNLLNKYEDEKMKALEII